MNAFRLLCVALEWLWLSLGCLCIVAAASLLVKPKLIERLAPSKNILTACGALIVGLLALYKVCQFRAFEYTDDCSMAASFAWNFLHGRGMTSYARDGILMSRASVHFAFLYAVLSPSLWIWNSAGMLGLVQGAAVGGAVVGVYLLGKRIVGKPAGAALGALVVASHPLFVELTRTSLAETVLAFPLFVWAAYFWISGRKGATAALGVLFLLTREEAPFALFGVGLALRSKRGFALSSAAALLWLIEMKVIGAARVGAPHPDMWKWFSTLGGSQRAVRYAALHKPWLFLTSLVLPLDKLVAPGLALLSFAALPLFAGPYFWPAAIPWLPHQLADAYTGYHQLLFYYSGILFGPLALATLYGLKRAYELFPRKRRYVTAAVLAVCAVNFASVREFRVLRAPNVWWRIGPHALAQIPDDAAVLCDDYFLPHLVTRRYAAPLGRHLPDAPVPIFVPDRVLLSDYWIGFADGDAQRRYFALFNRHHLQPIFKEGDLTVFANPATLGKEGVDEPETDSL